MGGKTMTVQKMVYNGNKGYQEAQGQKMDLKPEEMEELKEEADLHARLHPEKYGLKYTLKGMESVNGQNAYVLQAVNAKGKKTTEYYDATSGLLIRKIQSDGDKSQTSDYEDYREIPGSGGFKVPYKISETGNGQTISETVQSVEINKGVKDSEFE
jgi:hypothetical protein